MPKQDAPLKVEIPKPSDEGPAWSRVGVIAALGFLVGIAWPRLAGVKIGPSAPDDDRPKESASASPAPSAAPAAAAALVPSGQPAAAPSGPAAPGAEAPSNKQLVVIGPGTIARCRDKKNKKVDECGQLQFDPIALPKLKELATCPSALGLDGKMSIGFEIDFEKKEVQVIKGKKTSLPNSTVNGILQCAAREFSNVSLEDVPHKHRRYTLHYTAAFYPPGKHPEGDGKPTEGEGEGEAAAGSTTSESEASGQATVNWDTALIRKEPKDGDVVMRLVRGTKVKLVGRQNDWYKVEHGSKSGWVHRNAIGL
jgi:hypothetical protein